GRMSRLGTVAPRPRQAFGARDGGEQHHEGCSAMMDRVPADPAPIERWRGIAGFLIVTAFTTITLRDLLSGERIPAYRDLISFFVPFKHFLSEQFHRGEVPLWNPLIYMGTPFLAGLQSGVFY